MFYRADGIPVVALVRGDHELNEPKLMRALGAKMIEKSAGFGFVAQNDREKVSYDKMKEKILDEMKHVFAPEFINRIDDTIIFRILSKENMHSIVDIMLGDLNKRLKEKELNITASDAVKDLLIQKGYKENQGARPLRRTIQQLVEDPLTDDLLAGKIKDGQSIEAELDGERVIFNVKKAKAPSNKKLVKAA
jgi:ATP-dependent Clp protease ATP-binding subunit ClpC